MAVQFILGRSGTGKTSYCIKAIVNALLEPAARQPLILLVPEQATYQAERAILADKRIAGYNRLNVFSFDRLQFLLSGKNTRPALSRLGQQMIIHRILRDNKGKLNVFDSSANRPGLGQQMAETITELHQYAKTPEDIEQLLNELQKDEHSNLTALKFADIGLILEEYLKFIEGRFVDPALQLTSACRAVGETDFVKGAKLWVDGFAGFTTSELAMLAELLKTVTDAKIALCLDPSNIDLANPDIERFDPVSLFNPTQCTYADLAEIVKKSKLQLAEPIILKKPIRFSSCPQLAHIEQNIFNLETSKKISAADNIRIISAPNARAEVQFVARQILRLVKEKDCRYRDIAVIASDIDRYQHYIRAYFDDYDIPFFIDKPKLLNQHPAIQLICSALQVVTSGFSHSDIFACLKTDLLPIERCDIDLLENYCLAFGIAGSDWTGEKAWHFEAEKNPHFDEQYINKIRLKVSGSLLGLRDKLCPVNNPAKTLIAEEFTRYIFAFLDELKVKETIGGWIEEAGEHQQFYNKLVDIFDELIEVFAGRQMSCEDYLAIVNSAFSQLTLAFIPPRLDQVLVGSIERSRHPDLKAVFLIGATQKQFPVPVNYNGILTDDDRSVAESADFTLAAAASQKLAERQYLAYIAFTRPSQFLFVTYPLVNEKSSAVARSQFIANLESLFENLNEEPIAGEQVRIEKVNSETELADLLCSELGKDAFVSQTSNNGRLSKLLNALHSDEEFAELGSTVLSALNYDNRAHLDKTIVAKLFSQQIKSSATKLSSFASCPYQYFARYTLDLKERKAFTSEPFDLGKFYHCVLDALLKKLNADKKDFATIKDDELLRLLREQTSKLIQTDSFISNFAHRSFHNAFIIDSACEILENCVLAVAKMVRAGSFKPFLSEVSFGQADDELGEYKIGLSNNRTLYLRGKIDRLDITEIDGERTALVFDYKRRKTSFSWSDFYYGLNMHLPIYMLAVRNASDSQDKFQNIAGAFCMPIEVSPTTITLAQLTKKTDSFDYKARGIFNGNYFQQLDKSNSNEFYNFFVTKKVVR